MAWEPISPELVLVDPDLAARARAGLGEARPAAAAPRFATEPASSARPTREGHRPYPFWARVTAAVWVLVLGIMIGGAAIPHAQDTPRVVPRNDDLTVCVRPSPPAPPNRSRGISLHVPADARHVATP